MILSIAKSVALLTVMKKTACVAVPLLYKRRRRSTCCSPSLGTVMLRHALWTGCRHRSRCH